MEKIVIDGKEYVIENLSDKVKQFVTSIRFVDSEIVRLQNLIAVHKTARGVYINLIQNELGSGSK